MLILRIRTERNENGTIEKRVPEQKDHAEGPCSRTERNDSKKVGTCPALNEPSMGLRHSLSLKA